MKLPGILLLLPLLLCGCAREVSPVSALALDRVDGVYRLTAEVVRQDSLDDAASPAYLSATGDDLPTLLQNLSNVLPSELHLSHAQVLLISEEVADESILPPISSVITYISSLIYFRILSPSLARIFSSTVSLA